MNVSYINPRGISPKVFEGGSGCSVPLTDMPLVYIPLTYIPCIPLTHMPYYIYALHIYLSHIYPQYFLHIPLRYMPSTHIPFDGMWGGCFLQIIFGGYVYELTNYVYMYNNFFTKTFG